MNGLQEAVLTGDKLFMLMRIQVYVIGCVGCELDAGLLGTSGYLAGFIFGHAVSVNEFQFGTAQA
jgi:hypothetical protein